MKSDYPGRVPPTAGTHKLNADQTVAVATDVFWNEDMTSCPRGTKCQLLGAGDTAVQGDMLLPAIAELRGRPLADGPA